MLTALWLVTRDGRRRYVCELNRADDDPVLPLTAYQARQLAAELTAAADEVDPRPRHSRGSGGMPYGWRYVVRGTAQPDLAEMSVIDRICQHVHDGLTRSESVRELNALGLTTRAGLPWSRDSLRQVQVRLIRDGILSEHLYGPPAQPPLAQPELER